MPRKSLTKEEMAWKKVVVSINEMARLLGRDRRSIKRFWANKDLIKNIYLFFK